MKLIPTLLIGWLVFGFIQDASAFSCVEFRAGSTSVRNVVLNSTVPCVAPSSVVFSPVEFASFQQMQTDIAALQANGGGAVATVFDPILAGQIWMFALTMILGSFLLAKNAGLILEAIKRW